MDKTTTFHDASEYIIRLIKSVSLRWAGHVARTEKGGSSFKILQVNYRKETIREA